MSGSQDGEFVVEFEDDPEGAPPAAAPKGEREPEQPEPVSQEDLRALLERGKKQLESEREARDRAEARAAELERAAQEAQGALRTQTGARYQAEESAIDVAISAAEREADALVAQIGQLQAEGNFAEAAKMQRALARAEANAAALAERKASLATARLSATTETPPAQAPRQDAQPQIDLTRYSVPQRKWIREHPEYLEDEKLRTRLAGAHFLAVSEGCEIDSPEYFAVLENAYEKHFSGASSGAARQAQTEPPTARQGAPAMPVTRRAPDASPPARNVIRLTPDEREHADITMADVPEQDYRDEKGNLVPGRYRQYYENKQRLIRQGRLPGRVA